MRLGRKERRNAHSYATAEPKRLGDLHERMKFAVEAMASVDFQFAFFEEYIAEACRNKCAIKPELLALMIAHANLRYRALRWAIFDLQTEVKHYEPANPPMGRRTE